MKKQHKNRKNTQTKEDRADQKLQDNYPLIKELPKDIRNQFKTFFSSIASEQIDLIMNLSGKQISEEQRAKMREKG